MKLLPRTVEMDLWILSHEAVPAEAEVQQLIDHAADLGYDTSMLRHTEQPWGSPMFDV